MAQSIHGHQVMELMLALNKAIIPIGIRSDLLRVFLAS